MTLEQAINRHTGGTIYSGICQTCKKIFYTAKSRKHNYCSRICRFKNGHGEYIPCEICNKPTWERPSVIKMNRHNFCSRKCYAKGITGRNNPHWKGGCIDNAGYRAIRVNGVRIREHRYVVEQSLGRPLTSDEHIHHKDGNKLNNSIDNLQVMTNSEHRRLHGSHKH